MCNNLRALFTDGEVDLEALLVEVGAVQVNDHRIVATRREAEQYKSGNIRSGAMALDEDDDDWD